MANSDWSREKTAKSKMSPEEAFELYIRHLLSEQLRDSGYTIWGLTGTYREPISRRVVGKFRFRDPWSPRREYILYIHDLEELEEVLVTYRYPIPQSLATILGEYRQGCDGKEAVEFYTQSGSQF